MVERGGFPVVLTVALLAVARDLTVQVVGRRLVATLALFPYRGAQQQMRERLATALRELRCRMVAVAGHAVLLDQLLVERGFQAALGKWGALAGTQPNVGQGVARDAPLG